MLPAMQPIQVFKILNMLQAKQRGWWKQIVMTCQPNLLGYLDPRSLHDWSKCMFCKKITHKKKKGIAKRLHV